MSSPHIAGVAALIKQKYSTWSPSRIKSAMMTTSTQLNRGGSLSTTLKTPFAAGSGHVNPTAALNPGLVLDSSKSMQMIVAILQATSVAPAVVGGVIDVHLGGCQGVFDVLTSGL